MRVAILARCVAGPLGDEVRRQLAFFQARGAHARVFVQSADELPGDVAPCVRVYGHARQVLNDGFLQSVDLIIGHYDGFHALLRLLPCLAGGPARLLFHYHGLPRSGARTQDRVQRGLVWCADAAVVGDAVRRRELIEATGFPDIRIVRLASAQPAQPLSGVAASDRSALRLGFVSVRYGHDFAGGAETSLRTMAEVLHQAGHAVEIFTTCTRSEGDWKNELRAGTIHQGGVVVHRFAVDPTDRERHLDSVRRLVGSRGPVDPELQEEYLRHSVHSAPLLQALARRVDNLDAIVVGPYLFGLTHDVAERFAARTLVVPCFHEERLAELPVWVRTYSAVGGILYHSPEEQEFAEGKLGLDHPNAVVAGTYLASGEHRATPATRCAAGRYLVYCGRYSEQKGLPRLLAFAGRYHDLHPGRFRFLFLGHGSVPIPRVAWARDLGFVSAQRKREVLAGADALVQLSRQESLSLVALEAWSLGVPVLADRQCAVLAGQLRRSGGGQAVGDFAEFARALDGLWEDPVGWQRKGERGRQYVRSHYGSREDFAARLLTAIRRLRTPGLTPRHEAGKDPTTATASASWQGQWAQLVESLLEAGRPYRAQVAVEATAAAVRATAGDGELLLPIQLTNQGTHAVAASGPGRLVLVAQVEHQDGGPAAPRRETMLPQLLLPGQARAAVLCLPLPKQAGRYRIHAWVARPAGSGTSNETYQEGAPAMSVELTVDEPGRRPSPAVEPAEQLIRNGLAEVRRLRTLPRDYVDVTEGWLAPLKRRIKRAVLNNFKRGYVDVLAEQQSEFNRHLLTAVEQLAQRCDRLSHAVGVLQRRLARLEDRARRRRAVANKAARQ